MTSFFSLFVLMLSITLGLNVLAGAFEASPAFDDIDDSVFQNIGADIPTALEAKFDEGEVDCSDVDGTIDTLLEEICNPRKQNIETTSTLVANTTTTTTQVGTTQTVKLGSPTSELSEDIEDANILSVNSFNTVIKALTGEFILRAVAGAFFGFCDVESPSCDPDSQLPEEFVAGFAVIVLLMFVGMILSLLFGRSLATAG